jgi:hypothetical protein
MKILESKIPKEANMYKLGLHDSMRARLEDTEIEILRTPGGWIYRFFQFVPSENEWINTGNVFVPFDNEFNEFHKGWTND